MHNRVKSGVAVAEVEGMSILWIPRKGIGHEEKGTGKRKAFEGTS